MRKVRRNSPPHLGFGYFGAQAEVAISQQDPAAVQAFQPISSGTPVYADQDSADTQDPYDDPFLQVGNTRWLKKPTVKGLESLLPEWYQSPSNLLIRPKAFGLFIYLPEIFGIPYFPGEEIDSSESNAYLNALLDLYIKLYDIISENPQWAGKQGLDLLLKSTIGSEEFVKSTGVVSPVGILIALQPFLDPFYGIDESGYPLLKYENAGEFLTQFSAVFPEMAMAYKEAYLADPDAIPLDIILPPMSALISELSDSLKVEESDSDLDLGLSKEELQAQLDAEAAESQNGASAKDMLPPEEVVISPPPVFKEKSFLEKNWLLLALIGGGLYLKSKGKI